MNLSTNLSPSFSGIHSNTNAMTITQQEKTDSLYTALKNNDDYKRHEKRDIDVYILPREGNNSDIEIRYADLYSGNFITLNKSSNLKSQECGTDYTRMSNEIVDTLDKIQNGEIERPTVDKNEFFDGETDVFRLRPELFDELDDKIYNSDCLGSLFALRHVAYEDYIEKNTKYSKDTKF